jgi:hypothetical protein
MAKLTALNMCRSSTTQLNERTKTRTHFTLDYLCWQLEPAGNSPQTTSSQSCRPVSELSYFGMGADLRTSGAPSTAPQNENEVLPIVTADPHKRKTKTHIIAPNEATIAVMQLAVHEEVIEEVIEEMATVQTLVSIGTIP